MRILAPQLNKNAILLPFKRKVIFVDWYGVLSKNIFWENLLNNPRNRLHGKVAHLKETIFKNETLLHDWMKGKYTYENVLETDHSISDYDKKIIFNSLLSYCNGIYLNPMLYDLLLKASDRCFIVLATDNMDCFYESLKDLPQLNFFDAVISSHLIGSLKSENPKAFFGNWLAQHEMTFNDAMLIDDNIVNCKKFSSKGGKSIHYKSCDCECTDSIEKWLAG